MKKERNRWAEFYQSNKAYLLIFFIGLVMLILAKKYFFIVLFIMLNFFVLWMKHGIGFDSPVEVISFGVFMLAYKYSTMEALILLATDLIALSLTTRISFTKLSTTFSLFIIALSSPLLKVIPLPIAGILALAFRYIIDMIWNLIIMRNADYYRKIPQKIINSVFWVIFYLRFGEAFARLMAV